MSSSVEQYSPRTEEAKKRGVGYVRELKEELKKVTWTTREELILCTKVVVGSTFIFGIGIYVVDFAIKGALQSISGIVHLIFG